MEIGSEYWFSDDIKQQIGFNNCGQERFFLTGRTALDAIIKDIQSFRKVNSAYLPDYCCDAMIKPFIDNGLNIKFYHIESFNGSLNYYYDINHGCDIVLLLEYFGFNSGEIEQITKFENKAIIIQDITHTLFQQKLNLKQAQYLFGSYRKWDAVPAAAIAKKCDNPFSVKVDYKKTNQSFVNLRKEAMHLKAEYIKNNKGQKKEYLQLFNEAEELLNHDYQEYSADLDSISYIQSLDTELVVQNRRKNAAYLINGIKKLRYQLMFKNCNKNDCPLFVPILLKKENRDKLKKYLIDNEVYCPVHWPYSEIHNKFGITKRLYDSELSLICDQRYGINEMGKILELLNNFSRNECYE